MPYKAVNQRTGEVQTRYTLKEKYEYYKNKANNPNATNSQGKKVQFSGRVALANKANSIQRKMGANKRRYNYYRGK